mmetsp:Transcript_26338/g.63463  ORF Transcript_26338/g.63463 Transcript_26338/m.63463 type:complete len:88 (-) Transcript_26338:1610-1873(-)
MMATPMMVMGAIQGAERRKDGSAAMVLRREMSWDLQVFIRTKRASVKSCQVMRSKIGIVDFGDRACGCEKQNMRRDTCGQEEASCPR